MGRLQGGGDERTHEPVGSGLPGRALSLTALSDYCFAWVSHDRRADLSRVLTRRWRSLSPLALFVRSGSTWSAILELRTARISALVRSERGVRDEAGPGPTDAFALHAYKKDGDGGVAEVKKARDILADLGAAN